MQLDTFARHTGFARDLHLLAGKTKQESTHPQITCKSDTKQNIKLSTVGLQLDLDRSSCPTQ